MAFSPRQGDANGHQKAQEEPESDDFMLPAKLLAVGFAFIEQFMSSHTAHLPANIRLS